MQSNQTHDLSALNDASAYSASHFEDLVSTFVQVYESLTAQSVDSLARVYSDDVQFIDPLHALKGLEVVKKYMYNMYLNVKDYSVKITETAIHHNVAYLEWEMQFRHPKLNKGRQVSFEGVTKLVMSEKIDQHKDFYDAGAMLYEHLPIVGRVNRWVKQQAGES